MLVLTRKLPPSWLVFILLEGAIQTAGGEKLTSVLQSYECCELHDDQFGKMVSWVQ